MIEMELARNLSRCKREADAEPHFRASLEAMRAAQGSDPYYRAICARLFGELLVGKERPAEAHPLFVESLEAYQASGRNEPGVAERLRHMIEQTAGN